MLNNHSYCIIMAGGFGSRFWPISRADKPKQFLDFTSEGKSFLRQTYDRMKDIVPDDNILVVSLSRYEELVKEQLPELKDENLLLEPYNRNTAPCLAFANYTILKRDPLAVTLVMPSDQIIGDHVEFNRILANAFSYAAGTNALITIGVVPTRPDTNFGYIQMMNAHAEKDQPVNFSGIPEYLYGNRPKSKRSWSCTCRKSHDSGPDGRTFSAQIKSAVFSNGSTQTCLARP